MDLARILPVLGFVSCATAVALFATSSTTAHAAESPPVIAATVVAPLAPARLGEQSLDTDVGPKQAAPPVLVPHVATASKVRTPSDESLPKWVPVRGRLTVVDARDLAANLGLPPKAADETRPIPRADSMAEGSSWSYSKPARPARAKHRR